MTEDSLPVVGSPNEYGSKMRTSRIREAVALAGGKAAASRLSGVPHSTLGYYLMEGHETKVSVLERIADVSGVNLEWIITGRGPKMAAAGWPGLLGASAPDGAPTSQKADSISVPFYNILPPSLGNMRQELQHSSHFSVSSLLLKGVLSVDSDDICLVRNWGNDMSPTINSADIMIVDRKPSPILYGIYMVRLNGGIHVKRLTPKSETHMWVSADNQQFPPIEAETPLFRWGDGPDNEVLWIFGKVVYRFQGLS